MSVVASAALFFNGLNSYHFIMLPDYDQNKENAIPKSQTKPNPRTKPKSPKNGPRNPRKSHKQIPIIFQLIPILKLASLDAGLFEMGKFYHRTSFVHGGINFYMKFMGNIGGMGFVFFLSATWGILVLLASRLWVWDILRPTFRGWIFYIINSMGCCAAKPRDTIRNPVPQPTSQAPQPQPYQPPKPPQSGNNPQPSHYSYQKQYISPPSVIAKPAQPQPQPPKPIPQAPTDQNGYPDVLNYGNANKNYLEAAGRKAEDVLHDQDIGYYAANGRNVSMRVDMNH